MDVRRESEATPMKNRTEVERRSERELVVTRTVDAPARHVFEAWTKPELLKRWWAPKSFGISFISCEADVRTGDTYRFVFSHAASEQAVAFFGRYIEVTPHSRIVWMNEESRDGAVSTVTFEERATRRYWSCTNSIPQSKPSTRPSPPAARARAGRASSSRSWTHSSSLW